VKLKSCRSKLSAQRPAAGSIGCYADSASKKGTPLPRSIIEFYYKNDVLNDPMVSEEHITAFGWATPAELDDIMALALRVNRFSLRVISAVAGILPCSISRSSADAYGKAT